LLLASLCTGENATSRSASGKPTHYKPSTMSEMPQPQGSWTHVNAKRQSKYNMHLLAGLGFTGFTLFAVKLTPILIYCLVLKISNNLFCNNLHRATRLALSTSTWAQI